jgi:hypothetical protein
MSAVPPLARTNEEAHLYMDLHPCACGESAFERSNAVHATDDGLVSVYRGTCARCGAAREVRFRLPEQVQFPTTPMRFGGEQPSELLDPGEWIAVADKLASVAPPGPALVDLEPRRRAARAVERAAAAIDEVLKFVPAGADAVPEDAFRSEVGRAVYAAEPGRFRRARLEAVRDTYRTIAGELAFT